MNLTPLEEEKLNQFGDEMAEMLGMKLDTEATPDAFGRKRWKTSVGNKTGIGLFRTLERFAGEKLVEIEKGRKAKKA
jgi:hypothetical protein